MKEQFPEPADLQIGDIVGNYRIISELGKGGMGMVYRAEHVQIGRPAAIKMLLPKLSSDAVSVQRFFNEARAASTLEHPAIVEIYDFGRHVDGRAFIVMQLLRGENLEARMRRQPIAPLEAANVIAQVAGVLAAAHKRGIVHRDLKPDNIFLTPNELVPGGTQVKLLDFGIAKLSGEAAPGIKTGSGVIVGTPAYMSPEHCMGSAHVDHRSDLYSLGCILFQLLTGRPPFSSDLGSGMVIAAQLRDEPPDVRKLRADVSEPLAMIVKRLLEKQPGQRFRDATELREALAVAGASAPFPPDIIAPLRGDGSAPSDSAHSTPDGEGSHEAKTEVMFARTATPTPSAALADDATSPSELAASRAQAAGSSRWKLTAVVVGIVAFAIVAVVTLGRGHRAFTPRAAVPPHRSIDMLVADFRNETGESLFDGAVELTIGMALEDAPFISSYSRAVARRASRSGTLDEKTARSLAVREGTFAVVSGSIRKTPSGFAITIRALEATSGQLIAKAETTAVSKASVLAAVGQLAVPLRRAMGDSTPEQAQRASIAKVTVASLEATHTYAAARDLMDNMEPAEAVKALLRVIEQDPSLAAAYTALATSYLNIDDGERARQAFERAFAHIDGMSERLGAETRGMYYVTQGEPRKAIEIYQRTLERFPDDRALLRHLSLAYAMVNQYRKALDTTNRILEQAPNDLLARMITAMHSLAAGEFEAAATHARELIRRQPTWPSHYGVLAEAEYLQGHRSSALAAVEQLRLQPDGARPAAQLAAELALADGRTAEARAFAEQALSANLRVGDTRDAATMCTYIARAGLARSETTAAIEALDRAIAISSERGIAFEVARSYLIAGQVEKSKAIADQLSRRFEERERAWAKILEGEIALHDGRTSDAIQWLTEVQQKIDPWIATYDLGLAYLEAGAYPQAYDTLSSAVQRRGEIAIDQLPPVWYYLGRAQEGLKSPTAAESYRAYLALRAAADVDPLSVDARRRLAAIKGN